MGTVTSIVDLRRRAEARLGRTATSAADRVLHELEVHQVELEMQNDELRRLQTALEQARDAYRDLYDQAPSGYVTLDGSGRIVEANLTVALMLGVERAALLGRPLAAFVVGPDADRFHLHRRALAGGRRATLEVAMRTRDGRRIEALLDSVPAPAGGAAGCRMAIVGLGDRQTGEASARLQAVLDTVADAVVTMTADGRIDSVNQATARMFGFRAEDLVGQPIEVLLPAPLAGEPGGHLSRHLARGELGVLGGGRAVIGRRRDGSTFPLDLAIGEIDGAGVRRFVGVLRDVGDQRQRDEELRESVRRFDQIADHLTDMFYVADSATGRVVYASPAAEAILGRGTGELLAAAHGWLDQVHPDDVLRVATAMEERREGRALDEEYRIVRPDGVPRIVHDRAFPAEPGGQCAGIIHDVTEERTVEQRLLQVHRLDGIGALAAGISHDFNNVLSVVGALLERAQASLDPGHEADPYLEHALGVLGHGRQLTAQLVGFSRNRPTERRPTTVDRVVDRTAVLLRPLLGHGVELRVLLGSGARRALIDPVELEQVLLNLATNARDAMPDGGEITIATRAVTRPADQAQGEGLPERAIAIAVCDTGAGMNEATRAHVFEPFFTTKAPGLGTGLGLATSQAIIRRSSGRIDVESAPGAGTTFTIHLPETDLPEDEPPAARAPAPAPAPIIGGPAPAPADTTILIVEDSTGSRLAMVDHLVAIGYQVLSTDRPSEALALARDHAIDLLVTDYGLPEMSGSVLARRLRAQRPGLRVLMLSGYPESDLPREGAFLQKPFGLDDLAAAVAASARPPTPR